MIETDCEIINAFFLPTLFESIVTTGITKKVVTKAPTLPKRVGHHQAPSGPVIPLNKKKTMMK